MPVIQRLLFHNLRVHKLIMAEKIACVEEIWILTSKCDVDFNLKHKKMKNFQIRLGFLASVNYTLKNSSNVKKS